MNKEGEGLSVVEVMGDGKDPVLSNEERIRVNGQACGPWGLGDFQEGSDAWKELDGDLSGNGSEEHVESLEVIGRPGLRIGGHRPSCKVGSTLFPCQNPASRGHLSGGGTLS